jgi:hypothetical protein
MYCTGDLSAILAAAGLVVGRNIHGLEFIDDRIID